jgi:hypothetical protein
MTNRKGIGAEPGCFLGGLGEFVYSGVMIGKVCFSMSKRKTDYI